MAENSWAVMLDWSKILDMLKLDSINQISELKKEKALKKLTKTYGIETLLFYEPSQLDRLVAEELKIIMKKELMLLEKQREDMEKEMRSKVVPFKNGGVIKIDPRDFKDIDMDSSPEEILKAFSKKFMNQDDDDDEKKDKSNEDSSGYYI